MSKNVTEIFGGDDYDLGNNVEVDDLDSERQTVFALYVDESGSMSRYDNTMPSCIQMVKDAIIHSKSEDEFLISLTLFNHDVKRSGYKKVDEVSTNYSAIGGTALYDAIVGAQQSLMKNNKDSKDGYIDELRKNSITVKGIFVILTDGYDEHSKLKASDAKAAIEFMNKKEIITAYIGFGSKACGVGQDLGFKNVLDIEKADEKKLREIFDIVSKSAISASKNAVNPSAGSFFQV